MNEPVNRTAVDGYQATKHTRHIPPLFLRSATDHHHQRRVVVSGGQLTERGRRQGERQGTEGGPEVGDLVQRSLSCIGGSCLFSTNDAVSLAVCASDRRVSPVIVVAVMIEDDGGYNERRQAPWRHPTMVVAARASFRFRFGSRAQIQLRVSVQDRVSGFGFDSGSSQSWLRFWFKTNGSVQFQSKTVNRRFWLGSSQPVWVHRFGPDRARCHLGLVQVLHGSDSGSVNLVNSVNSGQLSE